MSLVGSNVAMVGATLLAMLAIEPRALLAQETVQQPDGAPPFLKEEPEPTPPAGESPAEAPAPTTTPETTPETTSPPTATTPETTPPPTATTETPSKAEERVIRSGGAFINLDLGIGVPAGDGGVFRSGFGRAVVIGYERDTWALEWRLFERYDLGFAHDSDAIIDASMRVSALSFRRAFDAGWTHWIPEASIGAASIASPTLIMGPNGNFIAEDRHGLAMVVSGGVLYALPAGLLLTANLRAYLTRWERVGDLVVTDVENGVPMLGNDPSGGIPITLNFGLRILL